MKCFAPDDPGLARYNVFAMRSVMGTIRLPVFRAALGDVADRQDALRISFADVSHDPRLIYLPRVDPPLSFTDISALPMDAKAVRLGEIIGAEDSRVCDLRAAPLWNVHLVRVEDDHHVLIVSMSHTIADGWSTELLMRDLFTAYHARTGGTASAQETPRTTFRSIAESQRTVTTAQEAYWRDHLVPTFPGVLYPLRTDPGDDRAAEDKVRFTFDESVAEDVRKIAWRVRTTPFALLLNVYRLLLAWRSGLRRVVIGTNTDARTGSGRAAQSVIGQMATNVYVETTAEFGASFLDSVAHVHAVLDGAIKHRGSFKDMARAVNPDFERQRPWPFLNLYHSWFQTMAPQGPPAQQSCGLAVQSVPRELWRNAEQERTFQDAGSLEMWIKRGAPSIILSGDRAGGYMTYNPSFFDTGMTQGFVRDYVRTVECAVSRPEGTVEDILEAARVRPTW